ncbi:retrovirus-related pol polyprotein from transposon TNT 1-94 [Tanacetum coccineum]
METIHITFDEMHPTMAPVRMSSGPEPIIMTPGQLESGLAPTDKELEIPTIKVLAKNPLSKSPQSITCFYILQPNPPIYSTTMIISEDETKDHPHDNSLEQSPRPYLPENSMASDAFCAFSIQNCLKCDLRTSKWSSIKDCWFQSMQDEIHEFYRLEVWELVPRPIYVMVIALKWIYKVKLDEYGDVLKNKARLVAKGYRQEEGIDFEESFCSIAR